MRNNPNPTLGKQERHHIIGNRSFEYNIFIPNKWGKVNSFPDRTGDEKSNVRKSGCAFFYKPNIKPLLNHPHIYYLRHFYFYTFFPRLFKSMEINAIGNIIYARMS